MNDRVPIIILLSASIFGTLADAEDVARFRRPVAIAAISDELMVTANERSGSISILNTRDHTVRELPVGKSPSDVVYLPGRSLLLVTDQSAHQLIALKQQGGDWTVAGNLQVSPYPVTVRVATDGSRAFVASLWSRTITIVDVATWLDSPKGLKVSASKTVPLPFAPREQLFIESAGKLIVADAFGSHLAVINPETAQMESDRELPAHGIRQLRLHPTKPKLLLTHQMLSRLAHTTLDDVHWGGLMVNCLRSLPLTAVLDPNSDPLKEGQLDYIGGPEQGAGDPAGFVIRSNGTLAMALSGTNEVVFDDGNHLYAKRVHVGDCPTAVALSADNNRAFVLNTLSDSISILDLDRRTVTGTISLGAIPELSAADRGERLFRSANLSHDRWFSCASCHVDGHTTGLLNDNLTDGSFGTAKRILTLRGVADTAPYAWSGRFETLAEQIQHSIRSTMQGKELPGDSVQDLESYLRTLPAPPPIGISNQASADRGAELFQRLECNNCHTQPAYTSSRIADVKLKDERGHAKYNPPSLRGISQNAPYFHDGRAKSLREVFAKFQHQLDVKLTDDQMADLITYLNGL